jgi:hypothetical protein
MKPRSGICAGLIVLMVAPVFAQVGGTPASTGDQMLTPAPVSGQAFATDVTSQERTNYLRGGVMFMGAYSNNILENISGHAESDASYTIMPMLNWGETTSRLQWQLNYAPGFTFYQRESSLNSTDQSAALNFQYRLSPHVSLSAQDRFYKSSNAFNEPDPTSTTIVSGGTQEPNFSVIAPVADQLTNSGNVAIAYQFALNAMAGASGSFSNLHYPNPSEVPGLNDSDSQGGNLFLSMRASLMHYFGVAYQYQRLLSDPFGISTETQTQTAMFFYSFSPSTRFSISVFGGPQYFNIAPIALPQESPTTGIRGWSPEAGASSSWRGKSSSFAFGYSHMISGGGGLQGAVHMDSANASVRHRFSKALSGSVVGGYTNNRTLAAAVLPFVDNGHTIQGTASVQQQLGQYLTLGLGYTRLYQTYTDVPIISRGPSTNREFVSLSYQFSRPLGH